MVLGLATTAFAAGMEFYSVAADGSWVEAPTFSAAMAGCDDFTDLLADDEKYLDAYQIKGDFFVEVPEAAAEYKVTYGAKKLFLVEVLESVVAFDAEVKALTVVAEDDAECGDYYVADSVVNYDDDDTYYASYTSKGLVKDVYVADAKNGTLNVLVGDKLVKANKLTYGTDVVFFDHDWKGYEVVNYTYVNVICDECGNVAPLYANATAAGKKAVKVEDAAGDTLGWITFADATNYGPAAPTVDADKVESAETFDAGIAMYVGMSVMAAAGSAVVLKKKD